MTDEPSPNYSGKPGGYSYDLRPGMKGLMTDAFDYVKECISREDDGTAIVDSIDRQRRTPRWMKEKTVAIDGAILTPDEKGQNWWLHKYKQEMALAEAKINARVEQDRLDQNDIIVFMRGWLKVFGMYDDREDVKPIHVKANERLQQQHQEMQQDFEKRKMDWQTFLLCLESDQPFLTVAKEYRNTYEAYGLDEFLDSSPSVLLLALKCGILVGMVQGALRGFKIVHADAAFLKASGLGAVSFFNVSLLAGVCKWASNIVVAAGMFVVGDRFATATSRGWYYMYGMRQQQQQQALLLHSMNNTKSKGGKTEELENVILDPKHLTSREKPLAPGDRVINGTVFRAGESRKFGGNEPEENATPMPLWSQLWNCIPERRGGRTTYHYAMGFGFAFASASVLPYWLLNSPSMAVNLGIGGFGLGAACGMFFGIGIQRLTALNVDRLNFTPNQFMGYRALMARERRRVDAEVDYCIKEQRRLANAASPPPVSMPQY